MVVNVGTSVYNPVLAWDNSINLKGNGNLTEITKLVIPYLRCYRKAYGLTRLWRDRDAPTKLMVFCNKRYNPSG